MTFLSTRSARAGVAVALAAPLSLGTVAFAAAAAEGDPDTIAPDTTLNRITVPASGWISGVTPFSITATDTGGSGVASVSYRIDGGAAVTLPGAASGQVFLSEGEHIVEYWSTDAAGNVDQPASATFRIDASFPRITYGNPPQLAQGSMVALDFACEDDLSGIASCESDLPVGAPVPTDTLGWHEISITATDVAGHSSHAPYVYQVVPADTAPPSVTISVAPEPASGWYTSYLGIAFDAADPSGIGSLHWASDGAVSANGDAVGESSLGWDHTFEGVTEFRAWAFDKLGNRSADVTRTVRLDTVAPAVTLPAAAEFEQGEEVELALDCTDATSGVAECGIVGSPSLLLDTTQVGPAQVAAYAVDRAGHRTEVVYEYTVTAPDPVEQPGEQPNEQPGEQPGEEPSEEPNEPAPAAPVEGSGDGASGGPATDRADSLATTGPDLLTGMIAAAGLLIGGALASLLRRIPERH